MGQRPDAAQKSKIFTILTLYRKTVPTLVLNYKRFIKA